MKSCFLLAVVLALNANAMGDNFVKDPISDFLVLPIKERYTDASEVVQIHRLFVDIDGDGVDEQFIGHHMMWWGDNIGWYGAFYKPVANGYLRLTPEDKAIGIDPRFFGPRETSYCGYVEERQAQGLLVLGNDFMSHDPNEPEKLIRPEQYATRKFYHILDGRLIVDELGPLDLRTPEGKAFFDRYFGEGVKSRSIRFEDYPITKLKELGYAIPNWKHSPESPAVQETPPSTVPLVVATPLPTASRSIASTTPTSAVKAKQSSSGFPVVLVAVGAVVILGIVIYLLRRKST